MKATAKKPAAAKPAATKFAPAKPTARGLGKGLSALMSDSYSQISVEASPAPQSAEGAAQQTLALSKLRSGKYQPRGYFDETALSELADSIRKNGVMQPILVRPIARDAYEIIAGERRWRAARMAGLDVIPVMIREMGDEQALEIALVENVQRADLHPLEEGAGYQRLMDEFGYTQEELAEAVHKSRSHIANLLRMLTLPQSIRELYMNDKITMGHARALMGLEPQNAALFAQEIMSRGLNVRQVEKLIRTYRDTKAPRKLRIKHEEPAQNIAVAQQANFAAEQPDFHAARRQGSKDPDVLALEETLSENLGLKVSIEDRGQSGEIMIAYASLEQLDEILRRLGGSV